MTSDTFSDQNANRTFQSVSHAHWCPKHEFLGVEIILQSFIAQMSENAGEQLKDYDTKNTLKNVISSKNSQKSAMLFMSAIRGSTGWQKI